MLTLRAPRAAAAYFRERDPDTAITESYIRRLIRDGDIPSVRNGAKILIAVESIEQYLAGKMGGDV